MGSTTGDALPYPDESDVVAPLEEWIERLALASQTALDRRPRAMTREFTTQRFQQPVNAYQYQEAISEDAAARTVPTFGYTYQSAGTEKGAFTLDDGIYTISWAGYLGAVATARSVAEIATAGDGTGGNVLARAEIPAGGDRIFMISPTLRLAAATKFWVRSFQATGATQTVTGRLRILRHGAL